MTEVSEACGTGPEQALSRDVWVVDAPGWRAPEADGELDDETVLSVLDQVPAHFAGALESLGETPIPSDRLTEMEVNDVEV